MAEWVKAASLDDCSEGCLHGVEVGGERIVLANVDGDVYALEDQCSHQDFPLSDGNVEDGKVECIHHGARFDPATGKALQLPAITPVRTFPVEVRDGEIYVQVE